MSLLKKSDWHSPGALACWVAIILSLIGLALWIWALVHAIKNPALDSNERLIWVIVIVLLQLLGALIYVFFGRKQGQKLP